MPETHPINEVDLAHLVQNLRVPDVNYQSAEESSLSATDISALCQELLKQGVLESEASLVKVLLAKVSPHWHRQRVVNLAFVCDRIFDTWERKSAVDPALMAYLRPLRLVFMDAMLRSDPSKLNALLAFFDGMAGDCIGWTEIPARSKHLFAEQVSALFADYLDHGQFDFQSAATSWQLFIEKHQQKVEKLLSRLLPVERRAAAMQFAEHQAKAWLNATLQEQTITVSAQQFLREQAVAMLARASLNDIASTDSTKRLLKKVVLCYASDTRAAFRYADDLLEELHAETNEVGLDVDLAVFEAMEQDLMAILQNQALPRDAFVAFDLDASLNTRAEILRARLGNATWLADEAGQRLRIAELFRDERSVLLVNYLGVKIERLTTGAMLSRLDARSLQSVPNHVSLSEVTQSSVKGLLRVTENQKKARVAAAEKARAEAEALLVARQKAEADAQRRAAEIAERTREMKLKKEEKKRLETEQRIRDSLQKMHLGAWIGIRQTDGAPRERYKLAVKIAAKDKFLFVDKHGVRKLQYEESELLAAVISGEVEVLSDGAEFEASLERVVSRIRMAR